MRLTLRTLLAYLDDILEPEDAREIGKKIEESEFAANLMHRTRDVIRRLRLAAPSVSEHGHGFDPNTVAEYLDNTLASDRVPDFEKVCLESDVQLAEVASCHQILAMVLGEPAEVDPALRQRMYDLPELAAAEPVEAERPAGPPPLEATPASATASVSVPVIATTEESKPARPKPTVPDYLREPAPGRNRFLSLAGAVMLILAVGLLVLASLRQFEPNSKLALMLGFSRPAQQAAVPAKPQVAPETPAAPVTPPESNADASKTATPEAAPTATPAKPEPEAKPAVAPVAGPTEKPVETPAEKPASAPVVAQPEPVAAPVPPAAAAGPDLPASKAEAPMPATTSLLPADPAPPPSVVGGTSAPPGAGPATSPASPAPPAAGAPPPSAVAINVPARSQPSEAEAAPMPPERLGRFVLDREVLLQFDGTSGAWMRLGPQAVLSSSVPLLSLPSYQPILMLTVGATVQLVGGTELELMGTDSQGVPGLKIQFGRVIARAVGETRARLRLRVADRTGTLTFQNAESTLGISLDRERAPGTNPEEQPGVIVASLYALSGDFTWEEGDGKPPIPFGAGSMLRVHNAPLQAPVSVAEMPSWLKGDDRSWLDQRAAPVLEQNIALNRPVSLSLRELANHRREEVAWLAMRSLGYLGEFDLMVASLNQPEQRAVWEDFLRALQGAVSRDPAAAQDIREAFERTYGAQNAPALYRMLWGYSPEQLNAGEGAKLVGYLENESLAYRVMGYYNLERLTGQKFGYRAQDTATKRQPALQRWKERLQGGLLGSPAGPVRSGPAKVVPEKPVL